MSHKSLFEHFRQTSTWRRAAGLARVVGFFSLVGVASGAFLLRSARAQMDERLMGVGRTLGDVATLTDTTYNFRVNGQHVMLSSGLSDESITKVLDRYEAHCRTGDGVFEDIAKQPWAQDAAKKAKKPLHDMVHRAHDGPQGYLVCARRGSSTARDLLAAVEQFGETRNLGVFGDMRYVYASRAANGSTRITLVWTEGDLLLDSLIPTDDHTEPPGRDPRYLPRPKDARRIMSLDAVGTKYNAFVYTTPHAADVVLEDMRGQMRAQDWVVLRHADDELRTLSLTKDGVTAFIAAQKDPESALTIVSMSEMESADSELDTMASDGLPTTAASEGAR